MALFKTRIVENQKTVERELFFIYSFVALLFAALLMWTTCKTFPRLLEIFSTNSVFMTLCTNIVFHYFAGILFFSPSLLAFHSLMRELKTLTKKKDYLKRIGRINHPYQGIGFTALCYLGSCYIGSRLFPDFITGHLAIFSACAAITAFSLCLLWHKLNEWSIKNVYFPEKENDPQG